LVFALAVVIAVSGVAYLNSNLTSKGPATGTATSVPPTTSSATDIQTSSTLPPACRGLGASPTSSQTTSSQYGVGRPDCLQLAVSLNSTTLQVGQHLGISMNVFNSLPSQNNVTNPNSYNGTNWEFGADPVFVWSPCWISQPLEFMAVQGNYTLSGLASADPAVPPPLLCSDQGQVHSVVFKPSSDVANVTGEVCTISCSRVLPPLAIPVDANLTIDGYYSITEATSPIYPNDSPGNVPKGEMPFVPGVYTLAVSTEWGQAKVIHFSVTQNSAVTSTTVQNALSLSAEVMNSSITLPISGRALVDFHVNSTASGTFYFEAIPNDTIPSIVQFSYLGDTGHFPITYEGLPDGLNASYPDGQALSGTSQGVLAVEVTAGAATPPGNYTLYLCVYQESGTGGEASAFPFTVDVTSR